MGYRARYYAYKYAKHQDPNKVNADLLSDLEMGDQAYLIKGIEDLKAGKSYEYSETKDVLVKRKGSYLKEMWDEFKSDTNVLRQKEIELYCTVTEMSTFKQHDARRAYVSRLYELSKAVMDLIEAERLFTNGTDYPLVFRSSTFPEHEEKPGFSPVYVVNMDNCDKEEDYYTYLCLVLVHD